MTPTRLYASLLRKNPYENPYERRTEMLAYCMKCRRKVEIKNPTQIKMKNGKPATKGVCPKCGTKVFRIGKG